MRFYGIFRPASLLFTQSWNIHSKNTSKSFPLLFWLLEEKSEPTHTRVYEKFKITISHPQTPVFIQHLFEEQDKMECHLNQIDNGVPNTQRKNKCFSDQRIKRIV